MTDIVMAFMALLLGAAILALVLLYRGWKSHRAQISDLRAQLAAQQIAALTGANHLPVPGGDLPAQEPVRRKRHLSLYVGGPVIAVYTTCREGLAQLIRSRPVFTVTAAAAVATAGTAAAALVMVPPGNPSDRDSPGPSAASTKQPEPGATSRASPDADPEATPDKTGPRGDEVWAGGLQGLTVVGAGETPAPNPSTLQAEDAPLTVQPAPETQETPDAAAPGQPPASEPPTSRPQPSTPPPGAEDPEAPSSPAPEGDDSTCMVAPSLVSMCVLTGS